MIATEVFLFVRTVPSRLAQGMGSKSYRPPLPIILTMRIDRLSEKKSLGEQSVAVLDQASARNHGSRLPQKTDELALS
jgi:hypothetical protein